MTTHLMKEVQGIFVLGPDEPLDFLHAESLEPHQAAIEKSEGYAAAQSSQGLGD